MQESFEHIEKQTLDVYRRNAEAFDQQRHKGLHERGWLERFAALLPPGGSVLDVGCGAAEPIAQYFIDEGFQVTGLDFSEPMIELAQARYPENDWICCDMREFDLQQRFDGIIAWNSFFHLTKDDQRSVLDRFVHHLAMGGVLMITVGPEEGEVLGHVNGEEVYHASLAPEEYTSILTQSGLHVVEFVFEDETCDFQTVLLAKRGA